LTAFNDEGCGYSDDLNVEILPAPEAVATFSDTVIGVGQAPVFFSEDAINATSFTWHTGDGYGFNGADFSHVYQDTGTYVAQLIASNGVCADTLEQTILVVPTSGLQAPELSALRVHPNPVRDELQIELPGGGPYTLRLFNTLGSVIATDQQPPLRQQHTRQLDMSSLSAGVYWLEVRTDDARSMFKLIKQ
ncbi:MAG: T9SS type A sorting domain-containing protein, partial [Bacteroidota bacterium]